jgi:hypothetical protein
MKEGVLSKKKVRDMINKRLDHALSVFAKSVQLKASPIKKIEKDV